MIVVSTVVPDANLDLLEAVVGGRSPVATNHLGLTL
jgi:hypothetical protein